ncbi:MAG: aminotransferase class I/II-fold pyridoxal phosphate-dependent enzyme [Phycisphaerae bacterium]|nr:aminotransferase class I/II-fold pyridoxal phosphate-dependent enzyme [Phycisphaerae bacterium]
MDYARILADRTGKVEFSGIRRFFELAARMKNPCDLSIGQPDYDAPDEMKQAAIDAVRAGHNRYTPNAGLPELREQIVAQLRKEFDGHEPTVLVTSGVSGGLTLALLATVGPGDEVVFLDPYFVSYVHLVNMVGGKPVTISSYPDFRFDAAAVEAAITPRTKVLMVNSPGNPTGRVMTPDEMTAAASIAKRHGLLLISDEIYDRLCYDAPSPCPLTLAPEHTLALRGFGKTYGVTGWRMGFAAGPAQIIQEMMKFQQYTFVCAPSIAQYATLAALKADVSQHRRDYARKRDLVCELLSPAFRFVRPGGGFYVFAEVPSQFRSATEFCEIAAEREVLVIPGSVFSRRDTHFRISYATTDEMLRRGCEKLCEIARAERR